MLKYPTKRRISRMNLRQRKKYQVGEFRKLTKNFEVQLVGGMDAKRIEEFSDRYWSYVNSIGLDSSGFDWNIDTSSKSNRRNYLIGWTGNRGRYTDTSSCTELQLKSVLMWLKEQHEVLKINNVWTNDYNYCALTWEEDVRCELVPYFNYGSAKGKLSYQWQISWFRDINQCKTSCIDCIDRICN